MVIVPLWNVGFREFALLLVCICGPLLCEVCFADADFLVLFPYVLAVFPELGWGDCNLREVTNTTIAPVNCWVKHP